MTDAPTILLTKDQLDMYRRIGLPDHPLIRHAFQLFLTAEALPVEETQSALSSELVEAFQKLVDENPDMAATLFSDDNIVPDNPFIVDNYKMIAELCPDASPEMIALYALDPRQIYNGDKLDQDRLAQIVDSFINLSPHMQTLCDMVPHYGVRNVDLLWMGQEAGRMTILRNITAAREALDTFNFDFYSRHDGADLRLLVEIHEYIAPCLKRPDLLNPPIARRLLELHQQLISVAKLTTSRPDRLSDIGDSLRFSARGHGGMVPENDIEYSWEGSSMAADKPVWALPHLWPVAKP